MDVTTRDVDMAFVDVICADEQWLHEQFDTLIAASFGQPPAAPPPAPPQVPPHRRHPALPRWRRLRPDPPAMAAPVIAPGYRRQRSPPA